MTEQSPTSTSDPSISETVDKTPPNGIKGMASAESWWTPEHVIAVVLPLLMSLLLIWLVLALLSRKKKNKSSRSPEIIDPWQQLGLQIQNLNEPLQSFSDESMAEWIHFASIVSLTARRITGAAVGEPCDDWTTDEFLRAVPSLTVKSNAKSGLDINAISTLLQSVDLVQFAGKAPDSTSAAKWIEQLKYWYHLEESYRTRGVVS